MGYGSMSTLEQVALLGVSAVAGGVLIGVEAAGVGGTVIGADALMTGASGLWARTGLKCADRCSKAARNGNVAYDVARSGGSHYGTLNNYANRSSAEIAKAIESYEQQVVLHGQKIANPAVYAERWGQMGVQEKAGLVAKWQNDMSRNQEIADVLRGLLESRR